MNCQFCGWEIESSQNLSEGTKKCSNCGAIYWLDFSDDLYLANQDAADFFEIPYEEMFEKIETKIIRNFDRIGDDKDDEFTEEVCLVFARKKIVEA